MLEPIPAPLSVLIVEDDVVTRRALCLAIEAQAGYRMVAALDTVAAALTWLATRRVDILLTDLGLPDGSGIEVIRACRAQSPTAEIVVISMTTDEEKVVTCIQAGATGYIFKDAIRPDLARVLLDLRTGGAPMSPAVARMVMARVRGEVGPAALPVMSLASPTGLSRREAVILELIARGNTYSHAAQQLGLSVGTVQCHIKHIYRKLSVHSRSEAVYEAQRRGYIAMSEVSLPANDATPELI